VLSLLIRFLSYLGLRYAIAQRDDPAYDHDALGFDGGLRSIIADLKAVPLFRFLDFGLAFDLQAATIGVHVVSATGRSTTSAAAAVTRASSASPTFRGRGSGDALLSASWGGGTPTAPT
jgi:hypothetical protein